MARAAAVKDLLLIGQCMVSRMKDAARVKVKTLEMDQRFLLYVPKYDVYYAHDPEKICKPGDVVLIEKLENKKTVDITHRVQEVVFKFGDVTDPVTGKKVVGGKYRDEIERKNKLIGLAEGGTGGFKYDEAPPRGWQEDKKDFSHKQTYLKYHEGPEGEDPDMVPWQP